MNGSGFLKLVFRQYQGQDLVSRYCSELLKTQTTLLCTDNFIQKTTFRGTNTVGNTHCTFEKSTVENKLLLQVFFQQNYDANQGYYQDVFSVAGNWVEQI